MPVGLKTLARCAANTHGGRIRSDEFRVRGFQLFELAHQAVVGSIRNFRVVRDVIAVFMMAQLFAQIFDFVFYGGAGPDHESLVRKSSQRDAAIALTLYRMNGRIDGRGS